MTRVARNSTDRGTIEFLLTVGMSTAVLVVAWEFRKSGNVASETGFGYALGIIGGLILLSLLVYPMRKRLPVLRQIGTIPNWFRLHMLFGVLGPVLIVVHSNFTLGSMNSRVALFAMLIVAASGFIGRFLYARIHRGLYGKKASLPELLDEVDQVREGASGTRSDWRIELESYQKTRLSSGYSVWKSFFLTLSGPFSRFQLKRRLTRSGCDDNARSALARYLHSLGRAEAFALYERLFAAWHLLHLPLFLILVLAAITHVIAVHLY